MPREWIAMTVLVLLLAGASRVPRAHAHAGKPFASVRTGTLTPARESGRRRP